MWERVRESVATYLQHTDRLAMGQAPHAHAIHGQYTITLLQATILGCRRVAQDLVDLQGRERGRKRESRVNERVPADRDVILLTVISLAS